ncbi:hypothetical protein CCHR01_08518 [Colletotrichum chrysophilum]|uniref:Uncharacterized protein n=1 Tax=Colletotrichum chrysophilum TaxID=1836956 RepID=A0AAD9AID7_9PEZI|nr:hypothetical protein CCHR01_08518 [Colletotrichum chrysophilum]
MGIRYWRSVRLSLTVSVPDDMSVMGCKKCPGSCSKVHVLFPRRDRMCSPAVATLRDYMAT